MSKRKEQAIAAALLNRSLHYLGELNVPFVLKLEGCDTIFSNTSPRHACAILEDAAHFSAMLREKGVEAKVERIVESDWGGST